MSILNVYMNEECALVGVDTDAVSPDGKRSHVAKMLVLAHIKAVLGARGDLDFFGQVFHLCHTSGLDLEGLVPEMPGILDKVLRAPQHAHLTRKEEFVLVGWSKKNDRPIGFKFVIKRSEPRPLTWEEFGTGFVSPPWWDADKEPPWEMLDDMVAVARAQAAYLKRRFPDGKQDGKFTSGGGRLIIARIERENLTISSPCDLGNLFDSKPTLTVVP